MILGASTALGTVLFDWRSALPLLCFALAPALFACSKSPPAESGRPDSSQGIAEGGADAPAEADAEPGADGDDSQPVPSNDASPAADGTTTPAEEAGVDAAAIDPFVLRPEWTGPCQAANGAIDVDLGNSPESFVQAAYCQITGTEPSASTVSTWANQLRTLEYVRRIDVVRTLCEQQGKTCTLSYSVPWTNDPPRVATCTRKTKRDMGAVMMFFFNCPNEPNCGMDWANTHAWGMMTPDPIYGFGSASANYYNPSNEGFWVRELLDARYAGLQFVLPNSYGFDIAPSTGQLPTVEAALKVIDGMGGGMKVGLFTDTWAWGEAAGGTLMNPAPDLSNTDAAAEQIYSVEWKPFFQQITQAHWYTVNGSPLIYFYNAGTLLPTSGADAVIARMKQLFQQDFGVAPFVDVDSGYGPTASGDATFVWNTPVAYPTTYLGTDTTATGNLTFDNAFVKFDSLGRDMPGAIATASSSIAKGPTILEQTLAESANDDLFLLETWNDLGEGSGVTRNYDYYWHGNWLTPDAFMGLIRAAQCSN
jgi:hypothetical protein